MAHGAVLENHQGAGLFNTNNMEVMGHLPIEALGGSKPITVDTFGDKLIVNDIWGWTDPETGNEYALVGRSDATAFVNVTNPRDPVFLGLLPSTSWNSRYRDIKTFGNHAYIDSDSPLDERTYFHGLQVFDLTRLRGLTEAPDEHWTPDVVHGELNGAHNVAINPESGLLVAVPPGFGFRTQIFDLKAYPLKLEPVGGI
ncbi:MAG: choice-of-anchor B family protein [Planctomycetales bacterium]|nr:choice-of-anchor B family protein [Planctomycetales bacterium]